MAGGSASALSLSRPAQASHALRPAGSLSRPRRPLSRGSDPAGYPTEPLASFRTYRQLSGWNPPPLMVRAFGAHCHIPTSAPADEEFRRGGRRATKWKLPATYEPGPNDVGDAHDPRKLPVRRREIPDHWVAVPSAKLSLLDVPQSPRSRVSKPRKRKSSGVRVGAGRGPCYLLRVLPGES
jgi:hypothetical protein